MAEHQVLYRQWRPLSFSEVVGQELVVNALRNQVRTNRLSHAYLFCGSRGTGKTSTAKILARAVNCEKPQDGDACGECDSCRRLREESSFDVLEYDAASNSQVDKMRDILETVQYPPQYGKYKVFILDEVHMLTNNAFNALLKTLEEPPDYMIFILATTEPQKVPATILSRCQRYDFGRIPARQIAGRLKQAAEAEGIVASDAALMQIARAAEGGMRDALSILDMCIGYGQGLDEALVSRVLGTSGREFLFRFAEALILEDASAVIGMIDELMNAGHEPAVFARELAGHLRMLLLAKSIPDGFAAMRDLTGETAESYKGQADTASASRLMSMLDIFLNVDAELRYAASPRLALESAALHACLRTGENDPAALLDRVQTLEQELKDLRGQIASGAVRVTKREKPEETPAPKKNVSAQETPSGDKTMHQIWKDALMALARKDAALFSVLNQGRLAGADDFTFHWTVSNSVDPIIAGLFRDPERVARVESILTETAGEQCRFLVEGAPGPDETPAAGQQSMDDVAETFGQNFTIQD